MKKLCMLLALILALACVPAMAAEGDAILGHTDENTLYFNYCFTDGDTLYLVAYGALYTYRIGEADLVERVYTWPEQGEENLDISAMPFLSGDTLYSINLTTRYDEITEFVGAKLAEMTLNEDGTATFRDVCDLDWSDLVEYYDDYSYPIRPESVIAAGGKAFIRYYNSAGEYTLSAIDLNSGRMEEVSDLRDCFALLPYKDDKLLVEQYNYDQSDAVRLLVYDPADESTQPLGEVAVSEYNPLLGLAYDPATDILYCAKGGEICPVDLAAGEVGEGVTDMPLEVYGNSNGACVMNGSYYAYCSEGALIRNLDPGQKAATKLKINDSSWSDSVSNAYYRFVNTHGDINVVLSRDYTESANLIEKMMNRDDSIDVYVLSTSSNIYDALYNRGYLMELDGSPKAAALAERMYPALREGLSTDGHLVAVPVSLYGWTLGINEKALEKMGMKLEDVPDDWGGFLDFLAGLAEPLKESNVHLFYSGLNARDAKYDLFNAIFEEYQRFVNANDPAMGYNTPLLRGLMQKLDAIDFVALGCAEPEESEDGEDLVRYADYSEELVLLQTGTGCSIGNFYSDYTPVLMRVDPDVPARLVLEASVAFINPFTKNPQAALEYIDDLVDNLASTVLYAVDPSLSEPVRGKWNEEYIADAKQVVEDLKAQLETVEPSEKQMLEESLRDAEENLEYFEKYGWEVSPREIEWYHAHADTLAVAKFNWLYSEDSGEAWDLMNQYREGHISADEMLASIDKKVQMMLLEGN